MNITTTKSIDNIEIRPGATWRRPAHNLYLTIAVECLSAHPERYAGRVELGGRTIVQTGPVADHAQAALDAQALLLDRIAELLTRA